jgi:hypothetical protein
LCAEFEPLDLFIQLKTYQGGKKPKINLPEMIVYGHGFSKPTLLAIAKNVGTTFVEDINSQDVLTFLDR